MDYSCNDLVKLRGVMPFIPEDPLYINNNVDGATTLIYTCPFNHICSIFNIVYSLEITSSGNVAMYVTDSSDGFLYNIIFVGSNGPYQQNNIVSLNIPFQINPTERLYLYGGTGSVLTVSLMTIERGFVLWVLVILILTRDRLLRSITL